MRPFGIGLAAALIVAALAPAAVLSAPKKGPDISAEARKQGMAEAPAIAQAAGIACKVVDARFVGKSEDRKAKVTNSYYEVDCDQGVGFILQSAVGQTPLTFNCIEASAPGPDGRPASLPCILPGNQDPKSDLGPVLAKGGVAACVPEKVRGIGQTSKNTYLEVACQGGSGYVLETSVSLDPAQPVQATNCLAFDDAGGNIKCVLTDKAARLAVADNYAAKSATGCTVKDRRYVGMSQGGSDFFEVACADGKGYLYKVDSGQLSQTYECAKASMVMGGCQLTNAREAETAQAALYSRLAKAAGFNCEVDKYAPFPSPAGKDIVEMSCTNRPDGGIGVFSAPGSPSVVYDCARAPIEGYRCSFTPPEAAVAILTADLKKFDKKDCQVSNSRLVGKTTKGTTFLEVACADGLKGYIIEYTSEPLQPVGVIGCAFSKDCKLPGNS